MTQAKMTAQQRAGVGEAAFQLANSVLKGDAGAVQAATIPQFAGNFRSTADLVHSTAAQTAADAAVIRQAYLLDASGRSTTDHGDAEFSCPLSGAAAETDFAIGGLPPGRYAFTVVEATGPKPWSLAFLLQATPSGTWQMAGFYPHAREAAGHDGLWYWTQARTDAKAGQDWLAWLLFGEADQLLRPANFVSSTNLDRLRSERRAAAPAALGEGVSNTQPMSLQGQGGVVYEITGLNSQASEDSQTLNLVLRLRVAGAGDQAAITTRSVGAATALVAAHPELRTAFENVMITAEASDMDPTVTIRPINALVKTP